MHLTFHMCGLRFWEVPTGTLMNDIRTGIEDCSLAHIMLDVFNCVYCDSKS